jgi:YggT family protein
MFLVKSFFGTLDELINSVIWLLQIIVIVRVILSWANADPYNGFVRVIYKIADPLLRPFQKLLPAWRLGGLDLSPIFVYFSLEFVKQVANHLLIPLS